MRRLDWRGWLAVALFAVCAVVLVVALRGDASDSPSGGSFNAESDARFTEEQVAQRAGFTQSEGGIAWVGPKDCQVSAIMTTREGVQLYADAGGAVVTNPSGDVGVEFFPDPGCRELLLKALEAVK